MNFENEKRMSMEKLVKFDNSRKGCVDEQVKDILDLINKNENYYTTSSCAGRILLLEKNKDDKKREVNWLLAKHGHVELDEVNNALENATKDVWLQLDGAILHLCCRDNESAKLMLECACKAGFRAGIISLNKLNIEIMSQEKMSVIICKYGKKIIDDKYLNVLLSEINSRIEKNYKRLLKLFNVLQQNI